MLTIRLLSVSGVSTRSTSSMPSQYVRSSAKASRAVFGSSQRSMTGRTPALLMTPVDENLASRGFSQ